MADKAWFDTANVRLVSGGSVAETHVYLIDGDEQTEIFPVSHVSWYMDAHDPRGEAHMVVGLVEIDAIVPAKLVDFVIEPKFIISDVTPWYARLWLWLKAKDAEMKRRERG